MDRIIWMLFRRFVLMVSIKGFRASLTSYANKRTKFEGYNHIYGRGRVLDSTIGLFTYVTQARVINSVIGRYCSIGPDAIIGGLGRHPTHWLSTHPVFYSTLKQAGTSFAEKNYYEETARPVHIGNDVWIGARSLIMDGVTVGDGAIVAAGSVVVKDVEAYAIVAGVPARKIRSRYDEITVSQLLKAKWWNWPLAELKEAAPYFRTADLTAIQRFLEDKTSESPTH